MKKEFDHIFSGKRILLLGFGKEGQSSLRFLNKHFPGLDIHVADQNTSIEPLLREKGISSNNLGVNYNKRINDFDFVLKSPGIPFSVIKSVSEKTKISSQTELFLELFRDQTIGITGTKGKSTTSTLVYRILKNAGKKVLLLGNIGVPPLDMVDQIDPDTVVIFEMSAHQLEDIQISPHIAVLLNIFEEHLDHFNSYEAYRNAKFNVFKYQKTADWLIINEGDAHILAHTTQAGIGSKVLTISASENLGDGASVLARERIKYRREGSEKIMDFSTRMSIPGNHNLFNIMASVCVAKLLDIDDGIIEQSVIQFEGLPHRMEYLGKFGGIHFYNDSIATIPEAAIEALKTLSKVDTLILGGKDRGINYKSLIDFLSDGWVSNIILTGEVGKRLGKELNKKTDQKSRLFEIDSFEELGAIIRKCTPVNGICLLSPAASSYDMFSNFEHRGQAFRIIAENI